MKYKPGQKVIIDILGKPNIWPHMNTEVREAHGTTAIIKEIVDFRTHYPVYRIVINGKAWLFAEEWLRGHKIISSGSNI